MKIELTKEQAQTLWECAGQMFTDDDDLEATVGKRRMACAKRAYNALSAQLGLGMRVA